MTIDELLEMARINTKQANSSVGRSNLEFAAVYAAIAQAAAQTAQAIDFHRYVDAWIAMGDLVDTREHNTPAEVAEAAFYDANIALWRKEQEEQETP